MSNISRSALLTLILGFTITLANAQTGKKIEHLRDNGKVQRSYFLYPSTLRMVNLQDIEEFNDIIKDLKKVTFLQMDMENYTLADFISTRKELLDQSKMEDFMTVENRNQQIYVMGKERPIETVILANVEDNRMLALIEGYLNLSQLPRFIEILSENDGEFDALFGNLFNNRSEEDWEDEQEEVIDTIQN